METNNLDIVYILGSGSRWNNNEIRYSLRSLERNLHYRDIYIVGEKLHWFKNIKHIPAKDPYQEKLKNALYKLKIACKIPQLSENFILMNDDFFILKKKKTIKYYYKKTLSQSKKDHPTKKGYYYESITNTEKLLKELKIKSKYDYSLHYPFIYNKNKLLMMLSLIEDKNEQLLLRTIYGNLFAVGGEKKRDVKIKNLQDLENPYFRESDVISTSETIVLRKQFQDFIKQRFQSYSKYEIRI
jgi:hypothetical protein